MASIINVFLLSVTLFCSPLFALSNDTSQSFLGESENVSNVSKRSVTASDYCFYLNEVASLDPSHLYDEKMSSDSSVASIIRRGEAGAYSYFVMTGREKMPMHFVSRINEALYCNWLQSHSGEKGIENEADRFDEINGTIPKNENASYWIADEDKSTSSSLGSSDFCFSVENISLQASLSFSQDSSSPLNNKNSVIWALLGTATVLVLTAEHPVIRSAEGVLEESSAEVARTVTEEALEHPNSETALNPTAVETHIETILGPLPEDEIVTAPPPSILPLHAKLHQLTELVKICKTRQEKAFQGRKALHAHSLSHERKGKLRASNYWKQVFPQVEEHEAFFKEAFKDALSRRKEAADINQAEYPAVFEALKKFVILKEAVADAHLAIVKALASSQEKSLPALTNRSLAIEESVASFDTEFHELIEYTTQLKQSKKEGKDFEISLYQGFLDIISRKLDYSFRAAQAGFNGKKEEEKQMLQAASLVSQSGDFFTQAIPPIIEYVNNSVQSWESGNPSIAMLWIKVATRLKTAADQYLLFTESSIKPESALLRNAHYRALGVLAHANHLKLAVERVVDYEQQYKEALKAGNKTQAALFNQQEVLWQKIAVYRDNATSARLENKQQQALDLTCAASSLTNQADHLVKLIPQLMMYSDKATAARLAGNELMANFYNSTKILIEKGPVYYSLEANAYEHSNKKNQRKFFQLATHYEENAQNMSEVWARLLESSFEFVHDNTKVSDVFKALENAKIITNQVVLKVSDGNHEVLERDCFLDMTSIAENIHRIIFWTSDAPKIIKARNSLKAIAQSFAENHSAMLADYSIDPDIDSSDINAARNAVTREVLPIPNPDLWATEWIKKYEVEQISEATSGNEYILKKMSDPMIPEGSPPLKTEFEWAYQTCKTVVDFTKLLNPNMLD